MRRLIIGGLLVLLPAVWLVTHRFRDGNLPIVDYVVRATDLPIVVTRSGTLEAQQSTTLHCEVENIAEAQRSSGSQIIYLVSNGSYVKQGDLLVELDSSGWREKIDIKELAVAQRVAMRTAATRLPMRISVKIFESSGVAVSIRP